jgi:hypothetical protein
MNRRAHYVLAQSKTENSDGARAAGGNLRQRVLRAIGCGCALRRCKGSSAFVVRQISQVLLRGGGGPVVRLPAGGETARAGAFGPRRPSSQVAQARGMDARIDGRA